MTTHPTPEALAADFNRYFTSANGVDVPARVSVPRDEWRAVYAALSAELAAAIESNTALRVEAGKLHSMGVADLNKIQVLTAERDSLRAERDAAFAMSRCECGTDEACANLAKLRAEVERLTDQAMQQVGEAVKMSGAAAFTTCCFDARIVPPGAALFSAPPVAEGV